MSINIKFERTIKTIVSRLADLLGAYVYAIDDAGWAVASSEPEGVALPLDLAQQEPGTYYLRVPLRLNGQEYGILVVGPAGEEVISPRAAQMLVELMVNQVLASSQLHDRHELKNKFIFDLLHGALTDEADIMREGEILGMDFSRPRAVLLIESQYVAALSSGSSHETREERLQRRAQLVISSIVRFFRLPSDAICAYIGEGQVAVLKASSSRDLADWANRTDRQDSNSASWTDLDALKKASNALLTQLRHDTNAPVSIGVGRYHSGILGLSSSYRDARAALSLGVRFHGHNRVHCLDSVGSAAFVGISDDSTKVDLARHLLSPLENEPELMETVRVFLSENCCPATTAERLAIHRNTLLYRLNKVRLLTGLNPHRFNDAVQISLAFLLLTLNHSPSCAPAQ